MSSYQLMPHVQLVPFDDHLLFYRKKASSLRLRTAFIKQLSWQLVEGFSKDQLADCLKCSLEQAQVLIKKLLAEKLICPKQTTLPRFDRLSAYLDKFSGMALMKLQSSRVLLLGVGGLGSYIFQHLMANGINTTVVDHDRVSESNLSRQTLYGPMDVGLLKTSVCVDQGKKFGTQVQAIEKKIASGQDLAEILKTDGFDLIISTIDEPVWLATQYVVTGAKSANVPLLRANSRAIGPFYLPGLSACPLCKSYQESQKITGAKNIIDRYKEGFKARRSAAISYELAFVALICVREAVHFLIGQKPQSLGQELCWSKEELSLRATPVEKTNCPTCEL